MGARIITFLNFPNQGKSECIGKIFNILIDKDLGGHIQSKKWKESFWSWVHYDWHPEQHSMYKLMSFLKGRDHCSSQSYVAWHPLRLWACGLTIGPVRLSWLQLCGFMPQAFTNNSVKTLYLLGGQIDLHQSKPRIRKKGKNEKKKPGLPSLLHLLKSEL